ncbi:MAG: AMP-binding protein [Bacteroidota bacterium]
MQIKHSFLHELIEESAITFQNHMAICEAADKKTSYAQLAELSDTIYKKLIQQAIPAQSRIVFYTEKSSETIAAFIACSKANLIYVPVSLLNPVARLQQIIQLASADYICIDSSHIALLEELSSCYSIESKIEITSLIFLQIAKKNTISITKDIAFILFTSGSTGLPKGVSISHRAALSFIEWSSKYFALDQRNQLLSIAPFNFDLSVFDIYATIMSGACLHLVAEQEIKNPMLIASYIDQAKINTIYATPTFYQTLLAYGKMHKYDFAQVKQILFAGEVFPREGIKQLKSVFHQAQLHNLYGPTETNVCTYYTLPASFDEQSKDAFPIGKACDYASCMLIDETMQKITAIQTPGELLVAGSSLFTNYWGNDAKTNEAFITIDNEKYYKTGDIAFYNEQNELMYTHRKDNMVKKNGYRIELEEITACLSQHENIQQVACVYLKQKNEILCFYISKTMEALDIISLKTFCTKYLPTYMIPNKFVYLNSFPTTVSGKTDKAQLVKNYEA